MAQTTNEVIYNSGLIISDQKELATLCVFYDTVYLPFTYMEVITGLTKLKTWYKTNRNLFYSGCLAQLKNPDSPEYDSGPLVRLMRDTAALEDLNPSFTSFLSNVIDELDDMPSLVEILYPKNGRKHANNKLSSLERLQASCFAIWADHMLRNDMLTPKMFHKMSFINNAENLIKIEAEEAMSYLVPKLGKLSPEEIIQVREKVADTREGFAFHLQKLAKGINARIQGDEDLTEISRWAQEQVYFELIPDYREFCRQLKAEQKGFWKKVLDPAGKILEITAAPWTPKFYGDLLKAFGFSALTYSAERKESLSNKAQAFQFMAAVEESKVAKYQRS